MIHRKLSRRGGELLKSLRPKFRPLFKAWEAMEFDAICREHKDYCRTCEACNIQDKMMKFGIQLDKLAESLDQALLHGESR